MSGRPSAIVTLFCCALMLMAPCSPVISEGAPAETWSDDASGPRTFIIENVGQWDAAARYQVAGGEGVMWLAADGLWLTLPEKASRPQEGTQVGRKQMPLESRSGVNLRLSFDGANPAARLVPYGAVETNVSYFRGSDPEQWHTNVPVWAGVRYVDLYPGLDLEIEGAPQGWRWRIVARAGAEGQQATPLQAVRLRVQGADSLSADDTALRIGTPVGDLRVPLLTAVNAAGAALALPADAPANRVEGEVLAAPFVAAAESVGPSAAALTFSYSTLLGGSVDDYGFAIAVDGAGRAYVTGRTASSDFPTSVGAYDGSRAGQYDIFVSALDATGSWFVYSTYIGGCCLDEANDIVLDGSGRAYITGRTDSIDFPTTLGALDRQLDGGNDAFVTVLNATGSGLVFSTLLGGSDWDGALGIALDGAGRAVVSGWTYSPNFPTTSDAYDPTLRDDADVFVTRLNADGSALVYSTFVGGVNYEEGGDIALGAQGAIYVSGWTSSQDYPTTTGALDTVFDGDTDAFVTVLHATGTTLLYSTLLGGADQDEVEGLVVDAAGRAHVAGWTYSDDYPATGQAYDNIPNGDSDAFVTVLAPTGAALAYSTFIGGSGFDAAHDIALDGAGRAHVTGWTFSADYPTTEGAFDDALDGDSDASLSVLSATGAELEYSTYLGGSSNDEGFGVAVDTAGRTFVTGYTESADYPKSMGAVDITYAAGEAFVTAFDCTMLSTHFAPASEWWDGLKFWAPQNRYPRMTGDVDGDGDDDVVAFHPDLGAHVALSTGSALLKPVVWTPEFNWLLNQYNWRAMGDVDGDGLDDIVAFKYASGVYVALSTGTSFAASSKWLDEYQTWGPQDTYPRLVGDVDGDGLADVVAIHPTDGVYVNLSTGSAFGATARWSTQAGWMSDVRSWVALGDVDGDGDDDLVNFRYGEGVYVALADGGYGARTLWWGGLKYWGPDTRYARLLGDVDGDGLADAVAWNPDSGGWVALSTGSAFLKPVVWTTDFSLARNHYNLHALGDLNGDGRDDALCFVYGEGVSVALSAR